MRPALLQTIGGLYKDLSGNIQRTGLLLQAVLFSNTKLEPQIKQNPNLPKLNSSLLKNEIYILAVFFWLDRSPRRLR